jgi:hypothetical protein
MDVTERLGEASVSERLNWLRSKAQAFVVVSAYRAGVCHGAQAFASKALTGGDFSALGRSLEAAGQEKNLLDMSHRMVRAVEIGEWLVSGEVTGNSIGATLELLQQTSGMELHPDYIDSAIELFEPKIKEMLDGQPGSFAQEALEIARLAYDLGTLDAAIAVAPEEKTEDVLETLQQLNERRDALKAELSERGW